MDHWGFKDEVKESAKRRRRMEDKEAVEEDLERGEEPHKGIAMTPINSSRDLAAVRSIPHAVIFFWVNWSIQAIQSRVVVEQAKSLDQTLPMSVPYFVVDVSDQHGEVWDALREWLQADDTATEQVVWAGSGALLWIRAGKVVYQMIDPMNYAPDDIAAVSKRVFSSA